MDAQTREVGDPAVAIFKHHATAHPAAHLPLLNVAALGEIERC
jgi:hypothetical protein